MSAIRIVWKNTGLPYGAYTDTVRFGQYQPSDTLRIPLSRITNAAGNYLEYTTHLTNECSAPPVTEDISNSVSGTIASYSNTRHGCIPEVSLYYSAANYNQVQVEGNYLYSFDGGLTFSPDNTFNAATGTVLNTVVAGPCGDSAFQTYTVPSTQPQVSIYTTDDSACTGNKSIVLWYDGYYDQAPPYLDHIEVVSQPAASNLPATLLPTAHINNLDTGKYVFTFRDTCGNAIIDSVYLDPSIFSTRVTDTLAKKFDCTAELYNHQAGITISSSRFGGMYLISFYNTTTGEYEQYEHSIMEVGPSRAAPTAARETLPYMEGYVSYPLAPGNFIVRVWPKDAPDSSCGTVDTLRAFPGSVAVSPKVALLPSLYTSCTDGSATIIASATGGQPWYEYTLHPSATNPNGNQPIYTGYNVFNNLLPGEDYTLVVTDACSATDTAAAQYTQAAYPLVASQATQPCPGESVIFTAANIPGGYFTFTGNDVVLQSGYENTYTYQAAAQGPYTKDTVRVIASFGSCDIVGSSEFVVDPTACGRVLPVTAITAQGSRLNTGANLVRWSVATPQGYEKFVVESSADARRFDALYTQAAGAAVEYRYEDQNAAGETRYYRIRGISHTGQVSYSNTITIAANMQATAHFELLMQPGSSARMLSYSLPQEEELSWTVRTIEGRKLFEGREAGRMQGRFYLNGTESLTPGVYIVEVAGSKGATARVKFTIF